MRRKFLASFPFLTAIIPGLAAQTQLSISQIKPNQTIVSESLTPSAANKLQLTLSFTPANPYLQLFINGLQVRPVRDYTLSGNVITLISAYSSLDSTSTFDAYYYK